VVRLLIVERAPELVLGPLLRHVGRSDATVWVETSAACTVAVLGRTAPTFEVAGHHYALVVVTGLDADTDPEGVPYDVSLDGAPVWPFPGMPPSVIRPLRDDRPVRVTFGSCRVARDEAVSRVGGYGSDALAAFAERMRAHPERARPDLMLMLGDQVYADDTSDENRRRIEARRGTSEPRDQVADFEEYTWLYHESWTPESVRWLMSTVPIAMIFDDHDVHDDWNTSRPWRRQMQATDWWQERVVGGLTSYWVYQHLGNLSPRELEQDDVWKAVQAADGDCEPLLREFAARADAEADGAKGYRWSYWRDLGDTRLVVLDSRCGRMLDGGPRSMLSDAEFRWAADRMSEAPQQHLMIGTSLPWLLSPALHAVEAWNERACDSRRPRVAAVAERIRQVVDLEHWAAFGDSFERLARLLAEIGSGPHAPRTISVLSGDVHHSYVCRADLGPVSPHVTSLVHQLTCSPMHNRMPRVMRLGFRASWNATVHRVVSVAARLVGLPVPVLRWELIGRPLVGNAVATLEVDGERLAMTLEEATDGGLSGRSLRLS
jgi:hypothetical protein